MLVGFFKKPEECECCIIKYVDRIWLSETGDAKILRTFVVEVNKNSKEALKEIRILSPFKYIKNLKPVNETCFLPSSKYYFNSPKVSTKQDYSIVQKPSDTDRFDNFGIITHDGIENIVVFPFLNNCSHYKVGDCTVIRIQLPRDLGKGESTEIRLNFETTSLFTKMTFGESPIYFIQFTYFSPRYIDEVAQLDKKLEIKVKPTLGEDKDQQRIGGFDTILYFPPGFEKASDFHPYKELVDFYDIQGKKTSDKMLKQIFRLRSILKRDKSLEEDKLTGIGQDIAISGTLTKKHDITKPLLSGIGVVNDKIRKSVSLSYVALTLAIISVILTIIAIMFKI